MIIYRVGFEPTPEAGPIIPLTALAKPKVRRNPPPSKGEHAPTFDPSGLMKVNQV